MNSNEKKKKEGISKWDGRVIQETISRAIKYEQRGKMVSISTETYQTENVSRH